MGGFFEDLHVGISLLGKGKFLRKIAWKYQELIVYIGDETRDIMAAREAEVKSIATAWGWESEAVLKQAGPDHLVRNTQELYELVEWLNYQSDKTLRR